MSIQINPPDIFTFTDFTPGSSESLTLLNPTAFPIAFRLTWQTEGCTASEPTRYTFEPAQGILKPLGEANSKKEILGSLKLTALLKYDFLSKDYLTVTTIALTEYRDKGVTHVDFESSSVKSKSYKIKITINRVILNECITKYASQGFHREMALIPEPKVITFSPPYELRCISMLRLRNPTFRRIAFQLMSSSLWISFTPNEGLIAPFHETFIAIQLVSLTCAKEEVLAVTLHKLGYTLDSSKQTLFLQAVYADNQLDFDISQMILSAKEETTDLVMETRIDCIIDLNHLKSVTSSPQSPNLTSPQLEARVSLVYGRAPNDIHRRRPRMRTNIPSARPLPRRTQMEREMDSNVDCLAFGIFFLLIGWICSWFLEESSRHSTDG